MNILNATLLLSLTLLLSSAGFAVQCEWPSSPNDIAKLYGEVGEVVEPAEVGITYNNKAFLVPIVVGIDEVTGKKSPKFFVPLTVQGLEPVTEKDSFEVLIELRNAHRELRLLQARNPALLSDTTGLNFSRLVGDLQTQEIVLQSIKNNNDDSTVEFHVDQALNASNDLILDLDDLIQKRGRAISSLNSFLDAPSNQALTSLKSDLSALFALISVLDSSARNYVNKMIELQLAIDQCSECNFSERPSIPFQNVSTFTQSVVIPLSEFQSLTNVVFSSLTQANSSVFYNSFLEKTRSLKASIEVDSTIYCEPVRVGEFEYASVEQAVTVILNPANRDFWSDQASVSELSVKWDSLQSALDSRDFGSATSLASDVDVLTENVLSAGFPEAEEDNLSFLVMAGLVLIVVLVAGFYFLRKRPEDQLDYYAPKAEMPRYP